MCVLIASRGIVSDLNAMAYNCTDSNITYPVYLKEPFLLTVFIIGIQIAIGVFGVIGNAMVCLTIIRKPLVLGAASQYLFSLAIADSGVLLFNLPIAILKEQNPHQWYLGEAICLYVAPATETFFGAAIFSITVIALERYVNIVQTTLQTRRMRSRNQRRVAVAVGWVASFAVTSVPLYFFYSYDSCHQACNLSWPSSMMSTIYIIALTVLLYVLPLAIIAFSYISIARLVSKRTRILLIEERSTANPDREAHAQSPNLRTMLRQNRKTHRILKPLVIMFAVTMFPSTALRLVATLWSDLSYKNYYVVIITLVFISTVVNSAADPIVYCVVNREFREEVKRILPGKFVQSANTVSGRRSQTSTRLAGRFRVTASELRNTLVHTTGV